MGVVGAPRRWSLLSRLSSLISPLGAAEGGTNENEKSDEADMAGLRQRMTPPQGAADAVSDAIRAGCSSKPAASLAKADAASSYRDIAWPGDRTELEWKPVILSGQGGSPAIPSLDELAEEGGIDPSTPRFPTD